MIKQLRIFLMGICFLATTANAADTMHDAAKTGDKAKVEALLSQGVDVNVKDSYGATPLHWAAYQGHKDVVKLLLAKGADVNAESEDGTIPLELATDNDHKGVIELLLAALPPDERLCKTVYNGTIEQVQASLREPVKFDHVCKGWGNTALEIVVLNDRANIVGTMLKTGATPKSIAKPDQPILHKLHGEKTAKLLLDAGAEVEARNTEGDTALCSIAGSRMRDGGDAAPGTSGRIAQALLAGKAAVNATCAEGATPLINAAHGGNIWVLKVLLNAGADVTRVDAKNRTALLWADHYATGKGSVSLQDKNEITERKEIAAALRAAGATR
jgi:ankyrin repeat protein